MGEVIRFPSASKVADSRGKPSGWTGRSYDRLAPTWAMLKMSDAEYDEAYEGILSGNDPVAFAEWLTGGDDAKDVAILCWEKDPRDCHRTQVADWMRAAGIAVEEWRHKAERDAERQETLNLFSD